MPVLLQMKALTMCVCVRGMRALDVTHVEGTDDVCVCEGYACAGRYSR